jgi:hypothetical protein
MDMSQENSLCSYLKQTQMSFFSFTKSENRRAEQVLSGAVGTILWEWGRYKEKESDIW